MQLAQAVANLPAAILSPNKLAAVLGFPRHLIECVGEDPARYYRPFDMARPGMKPRHIDNPIPPLKDIQKALYEALLQDLRFPSFIHGAVTGGSPMTHAAFHVGQRCVVALDVTDCYPSITNKMVFRIWRNVLGHSPTVARLLTTLTTHLGHLPQGAPTSPCIANLAILPAACGVARQAEAAGLVAGQFVDDAHLSGKFQNFDIITEVCRCFSRAGMCISRPKLHVMRSGKAQIVTGFTVNRKVGLPSRMRANIRTAVYELEKAAPKSPTFAKAYLSVLGRVRRLAAFHPTEGRSLLEKLQGLRVARRDR